MMIPSDISKTGLQISSAKSAIEPAREDAVDSAIKDSASAQGLHKIKDLALSESIEAAVKSAEFDADKINQITDAIRKGNYPLDARKIAESFIPFEQLL